jgi:chromosome partitioning protein
MAKEQTPQRQVIAVTSEKGGVGKSTLSVQLAGAWSRAGRQVALVDEDGRVGSALGWARRGPGLPFAVHDAQAVRPKDLRGLDLVLIDTEGRPRRRDLRELGERADVILIPSGVSALELEATRALWDYLRGEGAERRARAVLTRVPPVGSAGLAAREDLRESGVRVCNTLVRQYAAYLQAAEQGALLCDLPGPRAQAAWSDILALAAEVG